MSTDRRVVLLDALNLAYWCGAPPSLRVPLSVLAPLLARGDDARVYFDASAPHRLGADEATLYAHLVAHAGLVLVAPSGREADGLLLREARRSGACIVSRDRYRDHRRRYRKLIDDPARLLPGHVANDRVLVSGLSLEAPLAVTAAEAWTSLAPLLAA